MDTVPLGPGAEVRPRAHLVQRQVGGVAQRVLGEPGTGERRAHASDVHRLPGVARRGHREVAAVPVQPGAEQPDDLQRLHRAAREHRGLRCPDPRRDRTVGAEHDDGPRVHALHEPTAHDLGQHRQPVAADLA